MKSINELISKLRGEMSSRMDDSDIVEILEVLQEANEEVGRLNREIGGYAGSVEALSEEMGFIQSRMKILNNKMLNA